MLKVALGRRDVPFIPPPASNYISNCWFRFGIGISQMPGILHWFIHAQSFEFWYLAVRQNDLEKCGFSVAFGAFYRCLHLAFPCKGGRDTPCPRSGSYSSSPGLSRLFPPPFGVEWCVFTLIVSMEWRAWWLALRLHRVAVVSSEFILIRVRHYYSYRFWSRLGHSCRMMPHAQ